MPEEFQKGGRRNLFIELKMQKVEEIKRPLKLGEEYLVPCIVRYDDNTHVKTDFGWEETRNYTITDDKIITYITPVINLPHSDMENGQKEIHYHADFRFIKTDEIGRPINKHSKYVFCEELRPEEHKNGYLEYIMLPVVNEDFRSVTPVEFIQKSKLKHRHIHKGKCPHRGYDLCQVKVKGGVITCPLHGLNFLARTKELLDPLYAKAMMDVRTFQD